MKSQFTFYKKRTQVAKIISDWKISKPVFSILMGSILMFFCTVNTNAQSTLVVPDSNVGSAFIGPYGNAARQLQFIIDDTLLTSLVGKNLTSLSFRLPASTIDAWPPNALTMSAFDIYLSDSVEPADRVLDFVANVVGTQTKVRSGALQIPTGALTIGSNPNNFSFKINFTDSWQYNGGNLLIEIRHSGTGISSRSVQAVSTSTAGYGTLYSALWQSTSDVYQGNFIYVEITADGTLSSSAVKIGGNAVIYPNPVKDLLYVKSEKEFSSYLIYDLTGKLLLSEKIFEKTPVNVAGLPVGQYVLKLTDKIGNTEVTKFIKK